MFDHLLRGLAARGHEVTLVCGGPVNDHEFEVVDAGGTYSQYLRAPWLCWSRFRDVDVIIDVENGMPYWSPLWRRGPSVCLVHHVHTDQWQTRFPRPVAAVCRAVERHVMPVVYRSRRFVAISSSTADALVDIGVRRDKITVIECGVDLPSAPDSVKSDQPLFLSLNRLVPHKRVDVILRAWELAGGAAVGRLVVVGDGPQLDAIRRQASSISGVEVLGHVSEEVKLNLLARSWAVLSAAHHEGWGMSIMEGAALGTPALAVDAPGLRDAVVDGVTGILVPAEDESQVSAALAEALVGFANDDDRRRAMGIRALERTRHFSWDRCVERWESVLEEVAYSKNGRAGRQPAVSKSGDSLEVSPCS